MNFTQGIHQTLCSLQQMVSGLHGAWSKELAGVQSSLNSVLISGQVPQRLVQRNPRRVEVLIYNAGDKNLFLAPFTGEVDRSLFSLSIDPEETFVFNAHNYSQLYKQEIVGFWEENAAADSRAMITEFYISQ